MPREPVLFLLIILLIILSPSSSVAADDTFMTVGKNFLSFIDSEKEITSYEVLAVNEVDPNSVEIPIAYLMNLMGGGFILISNSTKITPIKAYSLKTSFDLMPEAFRRYILLELEYKIRALETATDIKSIGRDENAQRWDFLSNFDKTRYRYQPDTYLIKTRWAQYKPYNKSIPEINGENAKPGCVSVSVAQIMKYHKYPTSGRGCISYKWMGQILKTVLYRDYHWENMPDYLDVSSPVYMVDEVTKLLRDIAIANKTEFSLTNSWTTLKKEVLQKNFGFSSELSEMKNTDVDLFFNTIKDEIDANRPLLIEFPYHIAIADGYSSDPSGRKIHINFGWGGNDDGFYYLDQDVVTSSVTFPTKNLKIFYKIKPCSGYDCYTNLEAGDTITNLTITGKFNSAYDSDEYEVYLKGLTYITGTRGFSNQAFFISLYDCQNNFIISMKDPNYIVLNPNKYTVKISLCELNECYQYVQEYLNYIVIINSAPLTYNEKTSVNSNCEMAPVINNNFQDMILTYKDMPYKIFIDAYDENGDELYINVNSTNPHIYADMDDGNSILSIAAEPNAIDMKGKITLSASANGKTAEKDFEILIMDKNIFFGKEFQIRGEFFDQNTFNKYRVILDGNCSISGFRGFSNQAFFITVMDLLDNYIINPSDVKIDSTFSRTLYLLGSSLWQDPVSCSGQHYVYDSTKMNKYEISISCPDAGDDINSVSDLIDIESTSIKHVGKNYRYDKIQDAIEKASDGDTIIIHSGIYYENINFLGKAIIVCSENGPFNTVIDGNNISSVITFTNNEDTNTALIGFCIKNGLSGKGGGIICEDSSPMILRCLITENHASVSGGGLYCLNKTPFIINSFFWKNSINNGQENQIVIERDDLSFKDLRILGYSNDPRIFVRILDESFQWNNYMYYFFNKINSSSNYQIHEDKLLFISYFK